MSSNRIVRPPRLIAAFRQFSWRDLVGLDLVVGLVAGGLWVWLALDHPKRLLGLTGPAAGVVGVVLGGVLAGAAIQTAFLDTSFLRKLEAIGRNPVRYLLPFLFTAVLGVVAMFALLVLAALRPNDCPLLLAISGGLAGWFASWTIASLIPALGTLVQFIGLRQDAAMVPDAEEPNERPAS